MDPLMHQNLLLFGMANNSQIIVKNSKQWNDLTIIWFIWIIWFKYTTQYWTVFTDNTGNPGSFYKSETSLKTCNKAICTCLPLKITTIIYLCRSKCHKGLHTFKLAEQQPIDFPNPKRRSNWANGQAEISHWAGFGPTFGSSRLYTETRNSILLSVLQPIDFSNPKCKLRVQQRGFAVSFQSLIDK